MPSFGPGYAPACFFRNFIISTLFIVSSFKSFSQAGTVDVINPSGGFRIDGYLQRQGIAGDWLKGVSPRDADGTFTFSDAGTPLVSTGFHLVDLWDNSNDDVISHGKVGDDPRYIKWVPRRPQGRYDLGNVLVYFTSDLQGHIWVIMAVDRLRNNANCYVDMEFLQNPMIQNYNFDGSGGGFYSAGPHAGRTVGDLKITIGLDTDAGSSLYFNIWQPTNESKFDWISYTLPLGAAFAAANLTEISVPYTAFGSTTYAQQTFAEVAVDMTALLGSLSCGSRIFQTMWVTTKGSLSPNAELKDSFAPIQFPPGLTYILRANASPVTFANNTFSSQLTTLITPGPTSDYLFEWSIVSGPTGGALSAYNIPNPVFTATTCGRYYLKVEARTVANPTCVVADAIIGIDIPCGTGKPINPNRTVTASDVEVNPGLENIIQVYPNPSNGITTIKFHDTNNAYELALYDVLGRCLRKWNNIPAEIKLSDLKNGVYFIKASSRHSSETLSRKFIVNR